MPSERTRYKLHWAGQDAPKPELKWVIYDWQKPIAKVAYVQSRALGRQIVALLNGREAK